MAGEPIHSFRGAIFRWGLVLAAFAFGLPGPDLAQAQTPEFRGFWVYAWNSDLWTSSGVTKVVSDTRAGNMNMVVPQVRRRGDALYNSHYEPKCNDVAASFDPLADLIAKAHNTSGGQRLEVHPWLVTYHVWKATTTYPLPPQPDHPVNLHPDWLLQDVSGNTVIGGEYTLDPAHPAVQQHTFNVAMDIISNYDVDGLNFDYIRYSAVNEGYNPVSVARFNRLFKRAGTPSTTDPVWKQFRRDQVTALLRKIYLHAIALKPSIRISCDTITWTPAPTDDATWYSSTAAWNTVLQDWRGWMEEGILDLNIPMSYFRQPSHGLAYTNWSNFTKDHQFNRQAIIGPGIYLNSIQDSILQMRQTRQPTARGNAARGALGYAFHLTNSNGLSRATFLNALTSPSSYDPTTPPIFPSKVPTPEMPWKSAPMKGHLKGFVYADGTNADGAAVIVSGPLKRSQTNDATGFFGFVDLSPGQYSVVASYAGFETVTQTCAVVAGTVSTLNFQLPVYRAPTVVVQPLSQTVEAGSTVTLTAIGGGSQPLAYQWRLNQVNIPGSTSNVYELPAVTYSAEGEYSVVITNLAGKAVSSNATLTVTSPTPPSFSQIEVLENGGVGLRGTGATGPYYLDWSPDLKIWFPLTNFTSPTNGFYFLDSTPLDRQRFYRVRRFP